MSFIKKRFYFYDFFKTQDSIPPFYGSIINKGSHTILYDSFDTDKIEEYTLCKVNHLPDYLHINYNHKYNLNVKTLRRDVGYAIDLKGVTDINSYVNRQFKKGRTVRRYVNRLETSFHIKYKRYYGDIDKKEYDVLLECLFQMVKKRFVQLNDVNQQINDKRRWQTTLHETFSLIKKKRASLFVVYDDDKPIVISIGHHWGKVFYYLMCSFDIDYAKFALGHVNFYRQLEWCISEGYEIFDVGPGEYHYKKRWANQTYNLLQHVIYKKDSVLEQFIANVEMTLTLIKKYLTSEAIRSYIKSIKKTFKTNSYKELKYKINAIAEQDFTVSEYDEINYKSNSYAFLRRLLYDFLYSKNEHKSNVKIYKHSRDETKYIIKGKKSIAEYDII